MFHPYKSAAKYCRAAFLQDPTVETPVFVRFSTVNDGTGDGTGSPDRSRDVRRFAIQFYTSDGIFDLVGKNIPVCFPQHKATVSDSTPSMHVESDPTLQQNASAPDAFWDFISLAPVSLYRVMWVMSDRAIPRSFRMMEGFGVHPFRMVDAQGRATFIRWHWRPVIGTQSIQAVRCPAWELVIQPIPEDKLQDLDIDISDPTRRIREEQAPLVPIGKMVLDRWQNSFCARTEHTACHPGQLVPGIESVNDPLLQRRIGWYIDTRPFSHPGPPGGSLCRELQIHRPEYPIPEANRADHYSQARMFWHSMMPPEQRHIASAFTFELSKVETLAIRRRMLGHLEIIAPDLGGLVADALGMMGHVVHRP
jgi:catalase